MIYEVDPLQSIPTPTDWMVLQEDQHRRDLPITPGIVGEQPIQKWLELAVVRLFDAVEKSPPPLPAAVVPPPAFITWMQMRFVLYDRLPKVFGGEKQHNTLLLFISGGFENALET